MHQKLKKNDSIRDILVTKKKKDYAHMLYINHMTSRVTYQNICFQVTPKTLALQEAKLYQILIPVKYVIKIKYTLLPKIYYRKIGLNSFTSAISKENTHIMVEVLMLMIVYCSSPRSKTSDS